MAFPQHNPLKKKEKKKAGVNKDHHAWIFMWQFTAMCSCKAHSIASFAKKERTHWVFQGRGSLCGSFLFHISLTVFSLHTSQELNPRPLP